MNIHHRVVRLIFLLLIGIGLVACSSNNGNSGSTSAIVTDTDGDGFSDDADTCPLIANSDQEDMDGDGIGDVCDIDKDGDGVADSEDAFPEDETETNDTDEDSVGDNADICPLIANSDQEDMDGDGIGDVCDTDIDGDGVEDTVDVDIDDDGLIEISSLEQLDWIRNALDGTSLNDGSTAADDGCAILTGCIGYELTQNLEFDSNGDGQMNTDDTYYDYDGDSSNNGWLPIGTLASPFVAIFEGNGFEIRNIIIDRQGDDSETSGLYIGLFGYAGAETPATVIELRNLVLTGDLMNVTGYENTGALVGYANNASISDVYSAGSVSSEGTSADYTGGLVGYAYDTLIHASYTTGLVLGEGNSTGGLAGHAERSEITESHATGTVTGESYTGGLVGRAELSPINQSYATAEVSGTSNVGGLVGYAQSTKVIASYATGSVTGDSRVGGLIGYGHNGGSANASYATGLVTGAANTGGLIGWGYTYSINNSYWATDSTGQSLSHSGDGSRGGSVDELTAGVTLAQLQCPITANDVDCSPGTTLYSGWDAIDHDNDDTTSTISPWNFGDENTLPGL